MKRKFEEVFEEKIEGDHQDDFKVELFNEDETELIAKSSVDFCQTHVRTEINDHEEFGENEDVKIEIFEAEIKHEENNFEDFSEDGNQVVKTEINDHDEVSGNVDVKIQIFEGEVKYEEINFEDFAEENHFIEGCFTNAKHHIERQIVSVSDPISQKNATSGFT